MVRTVISGAPATMAGLIGLPVVGSERRPPRSRRCHQWAGPQGQPWVGIILRAMPPTCVCRTVNGALNPPCQRITSGSPYTHPSRHSSGRRQATSAWRSTAGSGFHRVVLLHQIPPCYLAEKILVTALIHWGGLARRLTVSIQQTPTAPDQDNVSLSLNLKSPERRCAATMPGFA